MSLELDATVAVAGTVTDAGRPPPPAGPGLQPGAMLAHFRIEGRLGRGGMGEVYRATDLALDRPVAVKVLPAEVAGDPMRRERLFREARSQARLQHPNVCHIYYVGQQDGVVFFAMELVAGESLAERIARGPLPPEQAVELVRQAALGLREAHRHGFTHRDVKPSNLMVDREGRVKVVDFGLVKGAEEIGQGHAHGQGVGSQDATGMVGTPLYMAPEQAAGGAIDARADIYALGATLHHLVSGRPPFEGDTLDRLVTLHRQEPRPRLATSGRRGRALSVVDATIARMMAKRPEDRFADYDALIAELERISPARTRPAGLIVRAFAALIDFTLLSILIAPVDLSTSLADRKLDENFVFMLGPLLASLCVHWWGTTPGRALLDLQVVSVHGAARPTLRAALLRHLVEYGLLAFGLALAGLAETFDVPWTVDLAAIPTVAGMIWAFAGVTWAALRTPDKRAPWDRVAGTMVRYRVRTIE